MTHPSDDSLKLPVIGPRQLLGNAAFVLGCAVAGGLLGTAAGGALGRLVPNYYRSVFRGGSGPGFDPFAAGIGQGLTQGAAPQPDAAGKAAAASARRPIGLFILMGALCATCAGIPAFGVGYVGGLLGNDVSRGNRDVDRVKRIMADEPARYGRLSINRGPADKFLLEGPVETQADFDALRDRLVREFGEERADFVMGGVEVRIREDVSRP